MLANPYTNYILFQKNFNIYSMEYLDKIEANKLVAKSIDSTTNYREVSKPFGSIQQSTSHAKTPLRKKAETI